MIQGQLTPLNIHSLERLRLRKDLLGSYYELRAAISMKQIKNKRKNMQQHIKI